MDFPPFLTDALTFLQTNIPAAIAAGFLVIFLIFKKPKFFFIMLFLILILLGVFNMINYISDVGTSHKKTMMQREVRPVE